MKKIVKTLPQSEFISLDKIESFTEKNIGIYISDSEIKGFLVPTDYNASGSELFWARAVSSFSIGNGWGSKNHPKSIKGWLEYFEGGDKVEFYYFDTPQELFKWLSE